MNSAILFKQASDWRIKVRLSIQTKYELDISFLHASENLEIISTNHGAIRGDTLVMSKGARYLEVVLVHVPQIDHIECIISHHKPAGVEQEVFLLSIPSVDALSHATPDIKVVNSTEASDGVKIFYKPEWKLQLSIVGDLRISVVAGGKDIFAAIGDEDEQSDASDFVFPLSQHHDHLTVPKEIIWIKHKDYRGHKLGCYELVKLDHHPNILYKVPISNKLDFADLPKQGAANLGTFIYPTGKPFDPSHWLINEKSNLPVYMR